MESIEFIGGAIIGLMFIGGAIIWLILNTIFTFRIVRWFLGWSWDSPAAMFVSWLFFAAICLFVYVLIWAALFSVTSEVFSSVQIIL